MSWDGVKIPVADVARHEWPQPTFSETVRLRRSYRAYLDTPVAPDIIREVLEDAQLAPSNFNTQPWHIHVVSGPKLSELAHILQAKHATGEVSADFTFELAGYNGCYKRRKDVCSNSLYNSLGIRREDRAGRARAIARNFDFFGAPHAAFLFMPSIGDNVRVAGDLGMYGQTFLLSLTAHGLGGIAQTALALYTDPIRAFLNIPNDFKLLFGISFGYPDMDDPVNNWIAARDPIQKTVTFHE